VNLKKAFLEENRIGDRGARAIATAPHFLKPTVLFLAHNRFSAETEKLVKDRSRR
jgi:hypothetical protein